jgi:hypothetical protein
MPSVKKIFVCVETLLIFFCERDEVCSAQSCGENQRCLSGSAERMEAIAETLEIMADPKAMQAIGRARRGQGIYYPVTVLDELSHR